MLSANRLCCRWLLLCGDPRAASLQDLRLDWRQGAEVFESLLIDHDWAVNTANWAYFAGALSWQRASCVRSCTLAPLYPSRARSCLVAAGVGNDPRNRRFNTVSQGEKYDPQAELISAWVSELSDLPIEARHRPWDQGGIDPEQYPEPIVDAEAQINRPRP